MAGLGLIIGALSGGANSAGQSLAQSEQFRQQQELESQRNQMRVEAERAAAEYKNKLENAPKDRFGGYLKQSAGENVPMTAAPVTTLDRAGAAAAGLTMGGISGNLKDLRDKYTAMLSAPGATEDQIANTSMLLDQLDAQEKAQQGLANKDAEGKTRSPSTTEAIRAAINNAAKAGDMQAVEAGKKALDTLLVHMSGEGAMYNALEQKAEFQNDTSQRIAEKRAASAERIAESRELTRKQIEDARLEFKKLSQEANQKIKYDLENSKDGVLSENTLKVMTRQYLAGDTTVLQNLGRGAQGSKNLVNLRNAIAAAATTEGFGGADMAAKIAEYGGIKAGQRTAGNRIANIEMASNEAASLIPLARSASDEVARSGLLPFGKAQIIFDNQTNDPRLRQFAAANNALINVYARAISPSGVPTISDKDHAREMLSTAMDQESYNAVLDQMEKEIMAARKAPKAVQKAFSEAVSGRGDHGSPAQSQPPAPNTNTKVVDFGSLK